MEQGLRLIRALAERERFVVATSVSGAVADTALAAGAELRRERPDAATLLAAMTDYAGVALRGGAARREHSPIA